jgi:hypothetical protein
MQKRPTCQSAFFNPRTLVVLLLCTAATLSILIPTRSELAFLHPRGPSNGSQRTLTFEERVSYQQAIEDVYWRHRIWPRNRGERKDPKPSLDAVVSQAQLGKKVAGYLRNSQALEDYWQRPITAEQLHAEMDRMAQHTKQPEVLQELFDALGNDPFVIAECLARPALAERLVTNWYAYDQRIHGELKQRAEAELRASRGCGIEQMKELSGKYGEIEFIKSDSSVAADNRSAGHAVKLSSPEWDETVQKLTALFADSPVAAGVSPAKGRALAAAPKTLGVAKEASITQIKTGVLSSLQEDESRYYTTAILNKTTDRLKLATVSWFKEPFESWLARIEDQVPTVLAAPSYNYALPAISGGGCIEDT